VSQRHSDGFDPPLRAKNVPEHILQASLSWTRPDGAHSILAAGIESRGSARASPGQVVYRVRHKARIRVRRRPPKRERTFQCHSLALTFCSPSREASRCWTPRHGAHSRPCRGQRIAWHRESLPWGGVFRSPTRSPNSRAAPSGASRGFFSAIRCKTWRHVDGTPPAVSHLDLLLHISVTSATSETYTTATIGIISVQKLDLGTQLPPPFGPIGTADKSFILEWFCQGSRPGDSP
jgi:hypothetical protein